MTKTYLYNIKHQIAQKLASLKPVKKEKLTESKMQELYGTNYKNILYYNYDAKKWSKKDYLGFVIPNENLKSRHTSTFKHFIESVYRFRNNELVAVAIMTVNPSDFTSWQSSLKAPQFSQSRSVIASLVSRDKKTGKLMASPTWFSVNTFQNVENAAKDGAYWLLRDGCMFPDVRAELVRQHTR